MEEKQKKKILIIEDEKTIAEILSYNIQGAGFISKAVYDGKTGLEEALGGDWDLVLLDLMLPVMDGFEVCREIRRMLDTPIIILTARAEENDKINGLELGADDYMTKPFSINELMSRIRANIRRYSNEFIADKITDKSIVLGDIKIDCAIYQVEKGGEVIPLSKKEYELLAFLAKNMGKVFSREELMEKVWGYDGYFGDLRTVDVTIARIRQKIDVEGTDTSIIKTKRGMGYYVSRSGEE